MGEKLLETYYREMIQASGERIKHLDQTKSSKHGNLSLDFNTENLTPSKIAELKYQLIQCSDLQLLSALREEFQRQLGNLENKLKTESKPAPAKVGESEHHYFRKEWSQDGKRGVKYWHFDNQRIAREIHLSVSGDPPLLLLAGRDDSGMCEWNLEEAKIVEELTEIISEADFNALWFQNAGFPYVRNTRKARRLVTSALFKKP